MKQRIAILVLIACVTLSPILLAQESKTPLALVSISKETKTKLKTARTVAIFLNGNDTLLTRVVEDALAIHLTNSGFAVTNREKLEKSVGEQITKKRKEKEGGSVNALDIGKGVNADSIITGTVIIESVEQKSLLVRIASFQLLDVAGEKALVRFLSEPERGKSFSKITKEFVDILKQNMK